jgi:hypothetical protein
VVTKLIECPHWLHKNCLEVGIIEDLLSSSSDIVHVQQWLRTANTCPVCREKVKASPKPAPARRRPYRDLSVPSETNSSTSGNGLSGRPPHTNPQLNNGRPGSFAAMVFDRLMNDGRDVTADAWSSSSSPVPPPPRDARSVYLERLRAQQQQQQQQQHPRESHQPPHAHDYHDMYIDLPPPHELPYHLRVPPPNQPGSSSSRPPAGAGLGGTDGSGVRPFGFVSLLRGQGSDSSMSTSSSISFFDSPVDEVDAGHGTSSYRSMTGTSGVPGSGSGPLFLDAPTMQRRETVFPFVPPSSGMFTSASGPAAPPPPPPPHPQQPSSFDAHGRPPTMVISNSTESSRDWRSTREYDALFNVEASRSSSSSSVSASQPRPIGVTNRIPIDEDAPFEDYMFGWNLHRGRAGTSPGP